MRRQGGGADGKKSWAARLNEAVGSGSDLSSLLRERGLGVEGPMGSLSRWATWARESKASAGQARRALEAALTACAETGRVEGVRRLLKSPMSSQALSEALVGAAREGHAQCVEALLATGRSWGEDGWALAEAAANGRLDCVRILSKACDPSARHSLALHSAASRGHIDCVRELAPVSDLEALDQRGRRAAESARARGHAAIADMLDDMAHQRRMRDRALEEREEIAAAAPTTPSPKRRPGL